MKKLLAIGLATCLPIGIAAEAPDESPQLLGTVDVLVIDDSVSIAKNLPCAAVAVEKPGRAGECMAVHRAVLSGHLQKSSALRERGRWL